MDSFITCYFLCYKIGSIFLVSRHPAMHTLANVLLCCWPIMSIIHCCVAYSCSERRHNMQGYWLCISILPWLALQKWNCRVGMLSRLCGMDTFFKAALPVCPPFSSVKEHSFSAPLLRTLGILIIKKKNATFHFLKYLIVLFVLISGKNFLFLLTVFLVCLLFFF